MLNESKVGGGEPCAAAEVKRWSAGRKKEVVLRLLRGELVMEVEILQKERRAKRPLVGRRSSR